MSTSVSKTGNTSSQRSCTVVPSPPSKGGCVSCPPDTICCLFMVLSTSAKHAVACLRCVSFCVRNDIQPFEKCHFCCSPGSQLPPPLAAHGGRSTDCPAGLQELGCGSRPNSSETIASCSLVHSSGAVLCPQLQPEWPLCSVGQQGHSRCGCSIVWSCGSQLALTLAHGRPFCFVHKSSASPKGSRPASSRSEHCGDGLLLPLQGSAADTSSKELGVPAAAKGLKAAPLRAAIQHPTVYSIVSALPFLSNQESKLLCFFVLFCFPIPPDGT